MTLTEEQQHIFEVVVNSPPHKVYILNSPAGTGKTYLVNAICNAMGDDVQVLAPTQKAASLYPPMFKVKTIHRFFRAKLEYTELGERVFGMNLPDLEKQTRLLIVDEASMVNKEMLSIFSKIVEAEKISIMFVCDEAQLPPVGEVMSPIFGLDHIKLELTRNMRSSNSADAHLVNSFRHNVFNTPKIGMRSALKCCPVSKIVDAFNTVNDCVILTWTGARKNEWNRIIRERKHNVPRDELERVYVGEQFIFSGYRSEGAVRYYTSDIITCVSLTTEETTLFYNPRRCKCVKKGELRCKTCRKVAGYRVGFYRIVDEYDTVWLVPHTERDIERIQMLAALRKKHILSLPLKERRMEWRNYYTWYETINPDLDYCYASTVHKAQGSEWKNVYVDTSSLAMSDEPIRDRLFYTASSRMREHLYSCSPRELEEGILAIL